MNSQKIIVVGSSNTDMVIKSLHLPAPGETILGGKFFMNPGGKGANQAVAAARLGGEVIFIARVGDDMFGKEAMEGFKKEGINTKYITTDPQNPSGIALIMVDEKGENSIAVASGANHTLMKEQIDLAGNEIKEATIVLTQLETPIETVEYLGEICKKSGIRFILNPAPARSLSDKLLNSVYLITPNETECEILTGIKVTDDSSAGMAARHLEEKGVKTVVITLGASGAYVYSDDFKGMVPATKVVAVDTTAAGDTFNGGLAVGIAEGMDIRQAVEFANNAAAISVTRLGAQAAVPYRNEIR